MQNDVFISNFLVDIPYDHDLAARMTYDRWMNRNDLRTQFPGESTNAHARA